MSRKLFASLGIFFTTVIGCGGEAPAPVGDMGGGTGGAAGSGGTAAQGGAAGSGAPGGSPSSGGSGTGGAGAGAGGVGAGAAGASGAGPAGMGGGAGFSGAGSGGMGGIAGAAGAGGGGLAGAGGMAGAGAGGAGGMAGGAGAGGTPGFEPCPATGTCRILPLGDSITDGFETPGGYRIELFRLGRADGKDFTFVGGSMNGPTMVDGQPFPRAHEGHSGWTVAQIDGIVPASLGVDPHIILLHIGTNDMNGNMAASAPARLETLVDQILADRPNALLVLALIIPFPARASSVTAFNAALPAIVEERAAEGKHIILVDQFTGFPSNSELPDGVHPNPAGYARMAGVWYDAISGYLR